MARRRWIPGFLALLALLVPLWGCEMTQTVTVQLRDFDSGGVEGLWLWRQAAHGRFQRSVQIRFLDTVQTASGEVLHYAVVHRDGDVFLVQPTPVERDTANPDRARLRFNVLLFDGAGRFRASTFNAAGESALSAQTLRLGRT